MPEISHSSMAGSRRPRRPWHSRGLALRIKMLFDDGGARLLKRALWEDRRTFLATIALAGLAALLEGLGIGLLVPFLDGLLKPDAEPIRTGWEWLDSTVLAVDAPSSARLYRISAFILGCVWLRAIVGFVSNLVSARLGQSAVHRLRLRVLSQLHALSLRFFASTRSGVLLNTFLRETGRVGDLIAILRMGIVNTFMLLAYSLAILVLSWHLSLIALLFCGSLFLLISKYLGRLRENGREQAHSHGHITAVASELIGGHRTITEFGTEDYEAARFASISDRHRSTLVRIAARSGLVGPVSQGVASTALIVLVIIAVEVLVARSLISIPALLAFLVVILRLLPLIQSLNTLRAQWALFRGSLDSVAELLDPADKPFLTDGSARLERFDHALELDGVSFCYEPGDQVLSGVSFTIARGETVALVGASGAGKSTLVDLLARLHDPTEGRILLDGRDLRAYRVADLRQHIAIVNQTTFLFNETVRTNITYGLEGVPDERVQAVAEEANAWGFIQQMPKGLDTPLGDRGVRLSGGQRQRIAIARALLRDPEILILDEATSALDSVSEQLVQASLELLMRGRTVIVIAHRLSTVMNADKVVVLEEGRVVEAGTYDELIIQKGQLWEYHTLQFQAA